MLYNYTSFLFADVDDLLKYVYIGFVIALLFEEMALEFGEVAGLV